LYASITTHTPALTAPSRSIPGGRDRLSLEHRDIPIVDQIKPTTWLQCRQSPGPDPVSNCLACDPEPSRKNIDAMEFHVKHPN
jgi:hypothetical protein